MEQEIQEFLSPAGRHRLSVREKEHAYRLLLKRRSEHAPKNAYGGSFLWRTLHSVFSSWTPVAALVILFVVTGAGLTFAQSSLPGDFLYSVKRIDENISTALSFNTESKVSTEEQHLSTRLDEAVQLQEKGKFTDNASSVIDQEYRLERRAALQNILDLQHAGDEAAAAQMRARLNATEDRYQRMLHGGNRQ